MVQSNKIKTVPDQISTEANNAFARKRSRGFALLSMISLAPLLLAFLLTIGALAHFISRQTQAENQCLNTLMKMQNHLATNLKNLMAKNKQALTLRNKERVAKLKLVAAIASGNAARIMMAEESLARVQLLQASLGLEQRNILTLSQSTTAKTQLELKSKMHMKITNYKLPIGLAVQPDIPSDIAPVYLLKNNFKDAQKSVAKYKLESAEFEINKKIYDFTCAATIEPRGPDIYRATLLAVANE